MDPEILEIYQAQASNAMSGKSNNHRPDHTFSHFYSCQGKFKQFDEGKCFETQTKGCHIRIEKTRGIEENRNRKQIGFHGTNGVGVEPDEIERTTCSITWREF